VQVNIGGHLAPGASVETLDIGNNLSLLSGSEFDYEIDSSVPLNVGADMVNVNGTLDINPTAVVNFSDAAVTDVHLDAGKYTLIAYTGPWDGDEFVGRPNGSIVHIGETDFFLRYDDTSGGFNFGGGTGNTFVTLTAVPEASVVVFGCALCAVLGLRYAKRKRVPNSPAAAF
jgi:hypothetical protein